ncbi:MAG: DUF2791 family P-loop domain-containing protein, partial [Actinobacteria bacterium]|nr:DUF2791 family P-loop domain-containing protein [Actinomycetota bacterium]
MNDDRLEARRAVEALRAGVPSATAVRRLGSGQQALEGRFRDLLERTEVAAREGAQAAGFVFRGGFGQGKSHLLAYFERVAHQAEYATSRVVISKETPLNDPAKVFMATVEGLRLPGTVGRGLEEAALRLRRRTDAPEYDALKIALEPGGPFNARFAATLHIYEAVRASDPEACDRMVQFWSGGSLVMGDLRRILRDLGVAGQFQFEALPVRELAPQLASFAALILRAAGLRGWVVLLDEVELVGRYSALARARSYAELGRWLGLADGPGRPGLATVAAITDDFSKAVLIDKGDLDRVGIQLEMRQAELVAAAEAGMRAIHGAPALEAPSDEVRARTYETLKNLHARAYDWSPPDVPSPEVLGTLAMRTFVRAWINAWDLRRLYPEHVGGEIYDVEQFRADYGEDPELVAIARGARRGGDNGASPQRAGGDAGSARADG